MKISEHITLAEAIRSETAKRRGIINQPDEDQIKKMKALAENIFERVRAGLGNKPIYISSFFRSKELNERIGGEPTSQHTKGEAVDLDNDVYGSPTNAEIFNYIKDNLIFDQLIAEDIDVNGNPGWVHVSYNFPQNRRQVLKMKRVNGKPIYETYS
jgi:hypothetical protein